MAEPYYEDEGSSPLARGLHLWRGKLTPRRRIIPARAGFTLALFAILFTAIGSSPLARGLHLGRNDDRGVGRIIPARAGFTLGASGDTMIVPDHPRSRGVYRRAPRCRSSCRGSSPLARGLLPQEARGGPEHRIIPARAGFTQCPRHPPARRRDHPRSRGVYQRGGDGPRHDGRIIPARAGFTLPGHSLAVR